MANPTAASYAQLTGDYQVDPAHTRIGFVARHAMVTKVRGSFNEFSGAAHIDGDNPSRSSVQMAIRVASIDTRNADRDAHLRSNDFLQLDEYPEITFTSTEVVWTGSDKLEIIGDLTIKGVTRPVTVPFRFEGAVTDPFGNSRVGFEGGTAISRKDFGITWNVALEAGGVLVGDKVELEFEVSAVKQS
jgi:polyisoprenoid-binding protein YceI